MEGEKRVCEVMSVTEVTYLVMWWILSECRLLLIEMYDVDIFSFVYSSSRLMALWLRICPWSMLRNWSRGQRASWRWLCREMRGRPCSISQTWMIAYLQLMPLTEMVRESLYSTQLNGFDSFCSIIPSSGVFKYLVENHS